MNNKTPRRLKVCHVITRMIVGGAQENTLYSVRGLVEGGHEAVLVTGPSPGREGKLLEHTGVSGCEVKTFPDLVRNISPRHDLLAYFALKRYFAAEGFDVVHTHSSKAGIVGRLAAHTAGVPVVVHTVHGQAFHPYQSRGVNRLYRLLERFAARCNDRIFAVAQAMVDQCVAAKVAKRELYQVVYSGMDTASFTAAKRDPELRRELGLPENTPVIATLARLFPQKGYEFVLPAAEKVIASGADVHFLLIGDGPMMAEVEKLNHEGPLAGRLHLAGLISPERVPAYLAQADLLWHLSLHEGLPRAVVQALAVGIPAVGFHLDGTPEVVLNGETGYTVPAEDVEAVARVTLPLLADPALRRRLGGQGQALVTEKFAWRRMSETLIAAYSELLAAKGK